jgi:hypothetical protein
MHQYYENITIEDKAVSVQSMDITALNDVTAINMNGNLHPGALYVGVDNRVVVKGSLPYETIYASISQGTIEKKGDGFYARVNKPGDAVITFMTSRKSGKTIDIRKVAFKCLLLEPAGQTAPVVSGKTTR